MRLDRSPHFDEERARFQLRFCCEDCGHFDAARERCRHEWPTELHRSARYLDEEAAIDNLVDKRVDKIDFCKEFELW